MARFRMYPLRANSVIQLFQWKDQIDLDPPYQRLSIWDREKKQNFIDSVINDFDIPKLYFRELSRPLEKPGQYKYAVVDGKQRLIALWEFMSNDLLLSRNFVFFEDPSMTAAGRSYNELMGSFPRLRARFDSFDVPVTVIQTDEDNFVEELFTRLNVQVPLSAPEFRNALGGPLPYLIRKVGVSPFFKESTRISQARLQNLDMAAKFLYLARVNAVESTKKVTLDAFVKDFRDRRQRGQPEASEQALGALEDATLGILDIMRDFFGQSSPLLASQGRATLYFHLFRIHRNMDRPVPFTRQMLEQFNEQVTAARKKSQRIALGADEASTELEQVLVYFDREKQSPNDAGAIKRQYSYMREYFRAVFNVALLDHD